ncbi:uncharacterized protein LOC106705550 [Latimeria chalumnae]|uniref:uncharacterized protein LOC106705550 n=1 Tax=Latimeria chalumnae TaxID=7897 RepID=UPI0006D8EADB|nr:PREDICTED: uncharacterized protein LOC106705550 [Latimeria chalumnae]|eukprot:XP_014350674.1 PREDICTED: uncharacterized protein LOC106705550 [Latimeria chalumnae]
MSRDLDPYVRAEFNAAINGQFAVLNLEMEDILQEPEMERERFKEAVSETRKEKLGIRPKSKKEQWISEEVDQLMEEVREVKTALLGDKGEDARDGQQQLLRQMLKEARQRLKDKLAFDKESYWKGIATIMENAFQTRHYKKLFATINRACGGRGKMMVFEPVTDDEGKEVSQRDHILEAWKSHFQKLLTRPAPENATETLEEIPPQPDDNPRMSDIIVEEAKKAVMQMRK